MLMTRGELGGWVRYGSAFSGVDTFAAALEAELGTNWEYVFASEKDATTRAALLSAWEGRGLRAEACYKDACSEEAAAGAMVDLWVCTSTCEAYSRRNHSRTAEAQNMALGKVWKGLEYVRRTRPRLVVMENVAEPSASGPMSGPISRLEGYEVEGGMLDPRMVASAPMARERYFWILTRKD